MEFSQAHAIIYNHLLDLHRQDPDFRFLLEPHKAYGGKGFLIDEDNIAISLWENTLKGHYPVLFSPISLYMTGSVAGICLVVSNTFIDSVEYLRKMALNLGFDETEKGDVYIWKKELPLKNSDYISVIDNFLNKEKISIDDYNSLNKEKISIDAYLKENYTKGPLLRTISEANFEENIAFNEGCLKTYLHKKATKKQNCVLKYLKVENYQGIKSLTINSLPNDAQWIFLTGENGFGKTSVLKAIAKSLAGDIRTGTPIDEKTIIVSSIIDASGDVNAQIVKRNSSKPPKCSVAAYGIARFNLTRDVNDYDNTYTLFKDDGYLLSIEKLLETADEPTFEKIKTIFKRIIPNLEDIQKNNVNGFYEIRYQEKNSDGDIFDLVKLQDLAAGYRGLIIMIGDMIRRFNPYLEKSFDNVTGIVIIDEFDAHLHPKYQYELPKLLSIAFPKIQFIVSTHSPIPLLGVEPNTAVVLTVNRTKELGITVERLDDDIDMSRLSANALLSSDIFNFKSIFARGSTPDTIESFDSYDEIKEMRETEKRLLLKNGLKALNIQLQK